MERSTMTHLRTSVYRSLPAVVLAFMAGACGGSSGDPPKRDGGGSDGGGDAGTAGIVVMPPAAPARTTEAGGEVVFYVSLGKAPTAQVTVPVVSSKPAEGKVSPAMLVFTTANWASPQKVTVTGVDDPAKDGDQTYTVAVGPAMSTDATYEGKSGAAVMLTNLDNEMAGLVVSAASNPTTEAGVEATFTVVLQSKPAGAVNVAVTSDDTGEGTVTPATLAFTPDNWNAPQTVTVTGVDDPDTDGPQSYTVTVGPVTGMDAAYTALMSVKVMLSNVDNDSPGISVVAAANLTVTEAGGSAELGVVLNARPSADVTVPISSSDTGEGTVTPASLTFTPANWNAPQKVTVTGVNDDVADGNQVFTVVTGAATSTDMGYMGVDANDVMVTCTDNDSAGVTVTPISGLGTTEAGGTATFTVVLNSMPSANVTIDVSSSDTTEGTVAPAALTFTPMNWNAPQTVTITGVNDDIADGNQTYNVVTAAAVSTDAAYMGVDPANVTGVVNTDNDSAGITVTPVLGISTTEAGGTATFTVVLNSMPSADVTIAISSSDTTEGTVSPAGLTFTAMNWNAPQTVTVTGVNDDIADGNQPYNIVTAAAVSTDMQYAGIDAANVVLSNTDNDSAGITVTPTTGLVTTEGGGTATFTVVLNSQPTSNVTIGITSNDTTEGTVTPATLTFTPANWNAPQTVTVTGVNDDVADGNQTYSILTAAATSTDTSYGGMDAANVAVSNTDNDSAGITVTPTTGLLTTEGGGTTTFTVVLNSQPTANVTIGVASNDTTEGTVTPATLTFTTMNWNAPQTVTITGVNDDIADGNQPYVVVTAAAVSSDTGYSGMDAPNVSANNIDNDSAGITVSAISGPTTEGGGTATFTVVLNSQPIANVAIGISSSDTTEGTVTPATLTFTSANWNAPQTVTVTGVNDDVADGNQPYSIVTAAAISIDLGYAGMDAANVSVSNTDNDTAGITVSAISGPTTEAGGTATFTVVLNSQPTANVVIGVTSSDTTEGTVAPASLTFTSVNWAAPQTVTVTGVNDDLDDGNQPYTIVTAAATSTDTGYSGMDAANVSVSNTDNDTAGITVSAISGATTEGAVTATFTVVLNSQPTADVVIGISSSDTTEGTVAPASLTFTSVNWAAPQTVTVTGVNDDLADGNQPYSIVTAAAVSTDLGYSGMDAANVSVSNTDNDTAGITVSMISGATTEGAVTATFTVVLNSQPTADVVIGVSSSDTTEGTVAPASLTFTSVNWAAPQTVTVTGVNDDLDDGNQMYSILTAAAVSTDTTGYSGMDAGNVTVTNTDNDSAGITVSMISGATTEGAVTATFTVVLNSEPTADVVIGISSSDTTEGTVAPASLTFTPVNWAAPQTVTVTGVNDDLDDGNQVFNILTAAAVSSDTTGYSGMDAANVSVTNTDNDTAGITVSMISGATTEGAVTATFTVVLNSEPTADVVIGISSSDTTEGTVAPASLTFTSVNWAAPQTVTVTGVNDDLDDGNQMYSIVTAAAVSTDTTGYSGMDAANVTVTNTDNDSAGITVSMISGATTEGAVTATFTVVLNSEPTADVVIGLSSSDTTEGTVAPASLTFTSVNWAAPQTVTVTGVNDALDDGNQMYSIVTAAAVSADTTGYSGMDAANVTVTNTDDDSAGITVSMISGATTEGATTATFTVVLNSEPTADVVIGLSSSDTTEGTVAPASLTFTSVNWAAPQTVTVTGVDDNLDDGNQPYNIVTAAAASADTTGYSGMDPANVAVTNNDNDTAGITVSAISGHTTEGATTATFTVVLSSEPTADVVIGISSSDTTEGTVGPASLTFTSVNWAAPQTVTVTGVNDNLADGDQPFNIVTAAAVSADTTGYSGMDAANVAVTNDDNDTAGITVSAISGATTEGATTATFTVVLDTQPTADVVIGISSNDTTEGTVAPAMLTFTMGNWNMAQTVTVTGVNDDLDDGNQPFSIVTAAAVSTDTTGYSGMDAANVSVTNNDNDASGFTFSATSGLVTTEAGGMATFTVRLSAQPTADVTFTLSSSDTTEGTVSPMTLTFTMGNWNIDQTVTVTGVDDMAGDGNIAYTIVTAAATSADTNYNNVNPSDVSVTNDDYEEKRLFETGFVDGALGGRAGADMVCTNAATGWAVGKTIHAFISIDANDEIQDMPGNYMLPTGGPIKDLTGTNTVADDWSDLLDGSLDVSLATAGVTSNGWWSFSTSAGALKVGTNCLGGTSNGGGDSGEYGHPNHTVPTWLDFGSAGCNDNVNLRLVCVAY
jgi:large repetitive protein